MNGIAQIIATLLYTNLGIHINTGIFILFLNIPVFILGFVKLGNNQRFLVSSMLLAFPLSLCLCQS